LPTHSRQLGQNRLDLALFVSDPDALFARDCQHIGLLAPLQPASQLAIVAVDTITTQKGQLHTSRERALQHLPSQSRFGRKRALVGNTRSTTALAIVGPFFWHIQLAIEKRVTVRTGV